MVISESLLKRVEGLLNADPSIFRKGSPFSLSMEEGFSDSDVFQCKSLSVEKKPKENRFELVTEKDAKKSAKGVVPRNTEKNNHWALNTFKA